MSGKGTVRQRALNYVLGLKVRPYRFVDAREDPTHYFVRYENPFRHGVYRQLTFGKADFKDIELQVKEAMRHLEWIAEGREFPERMKMFP